MAKLLLLSCVLASLAIPIFAARAPNPKLAVRRMVWQMALFYAFYIFAIFYIYPRLV